MSLPDAMSPKLRVMAGQGDKGRRKAERQRLGKLRQLVVSSKTEDRYRDSFDKFREFHKFDEHFALPEWTVFDDMVAEYIESLWEDGEPKSLANYTLAAIQFYRPEVKHRLPWSWKLVKVWNKVEVPQRAAPLSPDLLMAFAGQAFRWKNFDLGWLLVIGFTLFLRTGELLNIKAQDVVPRGNSGVLFLPSTKGAKRALIPLERVEICEKSTVQAFRYLLQGRQPGDLLWTESRATFMSLWHSLVSSLKLFNCNFFPYSLRRGGATSAYRAGSSLDQLVTKGRWQHVSTARLYLDTGLQALSTFQLPKEAIPGIRRARETFLSVSQVGTRGRR